jgi:fructokinase
LTLIRLDLWQDQNLLHACLDRALRLANVVKLSEEELILISGSNDIAQGSPASLSAISLNYCW